MFISFFFIITSVPLHRRISDVKHVAYWVLALWTILSAVQFSLCWEAALRVLPQETEGLTKFYVLTPPTYLTVQRSRLKMIPLIPTVALALFSAICSAFVILRVLLSTLPQPRSLGRRVYPVRFIFIFFFRFLSYTDRH